METDTLSLRKAAPQWSLAGDKQLLGMLEKIHQTIVSKCQDANAQLEAMVDALDNASVDLQNVNNKFMALSNSQFVESRVYDDDVDVAVENIQKQEPPKVPTAENNAEKIKLALQKLEMMHEPVHILDSDSSDDEEETRMVLKPKDVYSHRPLPYIIGSFAWKSKWHAGVLPEESDSDSGASRASGEQYSASEPEPDAPRRRTVSVSSSSSLLSEEPPVVQQKPADIAAEISRRLAGPPMKIPASPPEAAAMEPPPPAGKVYRMDVPTTATIFPDEPPPIDNVESDYSDDDIFAELHKKPHQNKPSQFKADIMDDLFRNNLSDVVRNVEGHMKSNTVREQSPISDDIPESKSITEVSTQKLTVDIESNLKKPVGGISLFGNNKGAESIGAAILKRNQRKSSSSDEEADVTDNKEIAKAQVDKPKEPITDSKKIIEDLFAKPVKKNEKDVKSKKPVVKQVINKVPTPVQSVKTTDKIDLFSDNLFDDIDDIFTTNVISKPKVDKNTKSIFDDDGDDLFSEITEKPEKTLKKDTKSIFDSDDDLFNENAKVEAKTSSKPVKVTSDKTNEQVNKKVKSIFDDDSDDDLFSNIKVTKTVDKKLLSSIMQSNNAHTEPINRNDKEIGNKEESRLETDTHILNVNIPEAKQFQSPSLFDDEDDELFNTTKRIDQNIDISESSSKVFDTDDITANEEKFKDDAEKQSSDNLESNEVPNVPIEEKTSDTLESEQQNSDNETNKEDTTDYDSNIQDNEFVQVNKANDHDVQIPEQDKEKVEYKDIFKDSILKDEPDLDTLTKVSNTQQHSQEPLLSASKESDLFDDIFTDLPPAFEKPSEPKKSKNVNALFDDDSDDETLFFKKDDVICDEKPEINFDSDRFTIFHDEPPDIDVDFSQKPLKTSNDMLKKNIFNEDNFKGQNDDKPVEYVLPQDLDDTITVSVSNTEPVHVSKTKEEIIKENIDISKLLEAEKTDSDSDKIKQDIFQDDIKIDRHETHSNEDHLDFSGEYETKKPIGKLKPMNFNINVNTLLPGASPKKSKTDEETDGQSISSTKSNEDLNIHSPSKESKSESSEFKMVKSVSFDGDPDSGILDNKLSKERAKIQVKRRPSSRRARLEAVRKSRIDLGSDSTDNSGSFDEPLPRKNYMDNADSSLEKDNSNKRSEETIVSTHTEFKSVDDKNPKNRKNVDSKTEVKSKVVYILNDEDIFSNPVNADVNDNTPNKKILNIVDDDDEDLFKPTKSSSQIEKSKNVPDNTQDQFNPDKPLFYNPTDKEVMNDKPSKKVLNIVDDDDDDGDNLFKATSNNSQKNKDKSLTGTEANNTLSLKDTETVPKKDEIQHKKSLFNDSDDDEELFKNKKIDQVKKSKIFDSESEDELFANKKKIEKKEIRKGPLFDDESDDDLFGTKTAKVADTKPQPSKPKETKSKSTEPVFEDPLSLLGDDS